MISMVRMFKQFFGAAILALGVQQAAAFSLLGPFEPYHVIVINYDSAGTEAWDAENNCKKEGWNNSHISSYKYI